MIFQPQGVEYATVRYVTETAKCNLHRQAVGLGYQVESEVLREQTATAFPL